MTVTCNPRAAILPCKETRNTVSCPVLGREPPCAAYFALVLLRRFISEAPFCAVVAPNGPTLMAENPRRAIFARVLVERRVLATGTRSAKPQRACVRVEVLAARTISFRYSSKCRDQYVDEDPPPHLGASLTSVLRNLAHKREVLARPQGLKTHF